MPKKISIDKEKILQRIEDIEDAKSELESYQKMSLKEFIKNKENYHWACYWLRIALEAVLVIGTHILSRIPYQGKRKDYTQVILSLGDYKVIPKIFAQKIKGMASYRNRLVHLYWKIAPEEMLTYLKEHLEDFNQFIYYIKKFMKGLS